MITIDRQPILRLVIDGVQRIDLRVAGSFFGIGCDASLPRV
jgi:hypothetical protein